jgi:Ca-activated chloride channel family protein
VLLAATAVATAGIYAGVRVRPAKSGAAANCPTTSHDVSLGVDPSALDWATDLVSAYNADLRQLSHQCVHIVVSALPLEHALQAIQATPYPGGGAPPDMWLPTSSTSVELLRARPTSSAVLPEASTSIASSPLVLAAPTEAMAALPVPAGGTLQFADYLNLTREPAGWAKLGHPNWGPVRFSSPDPHGSDTGVSLIEAVATTSAGVPLNQTTANTFGNQNAMAGVLAFVPALARTTSDPTQLFEAARAMASAASIVKSFGLMVATEQQVFRYNQTGGGVPLTAAYPFGGTYALDFPLVSLNGTWVDSFGHAAAADFATWTRTVQAREIIADNGLRGPDGAAGTLNLANSGLSQQRLAPQPAAAAGVNTARGLWNLFSRPTSVLAVCDTSGSMGEVVPGTGATRLELVRRAMGGALQAFQEQDHVGLWEFSTDLGAHDYREVVPLGALSMPVGGKPRMRALQDGFKALTPHAGTGLYDTVLAAYEYAQANYLEDGFNTIVLLTDGQNEDDNGISLDQLMTELAKHRDPNRPVHLITLAIGNETDPATLSRISQATDGVSYQSLDLTNIVQLFLSAQVTLAASA